MSKKMPIIKCMREEGALFCLINPRAKDIIWDALYGRRVQANRSGDKERYGEINIVMDGLDMKKGK